MVVDATLVTAGAAVLDEVRPLRHATNLAITVRFQPETATQRQPTDVGTTDLYGASITPSPFQEAMTQETIAPFVATTPAKPRS
ncbi:hypothetical protein [Haloparvum sp. AD34]